MRLGLFIFSVLIASAGCSSPIARPELPRSPENEQGRKLYIAKCARCHKLYDPRNYSDQEWQTWMVKMAKKSKLSPDQQEEISHYVEAAIRQPANQTKKPE